MLAALVAGRTERLLAALFLPAAFVLLAPVVLGALLPFPCPTFFVARPETRVGTAGADALAGRFAEAVFVF